MKAPKTLTLVAPDTGLNEAQLKFAQELINSFPSVATAYKEVKETEQKMKGKYLKLCEALRDPRDGVRLNGREMTLLLIGLGERKQRVTEIVKVVSVDDAVWAKYKQGILGFKAVLAIARNPDLPPEEAGHTDVEGDAGAASAEGAPAREPSGPKTADYPRPVQDMLLAILPDAVPVCAPLGKIPYMLRYSVPVGDMRRTVLLTMEVTDTPHAK